jgi:hypothetical protein
MTDDNKFLIKWAVIGGVGYLVLKPLLQKWGIIPTASQSQLNQQQQQIITAAPGSIEQVCSVTPSTQSAAAWLNIADDLYQLLNGISIFNFNSSEVTNTIVNNVKNDCDMLKLIAAFGNRQDTVFGVPVGSGSLPMFITNVYSQGSKNELNNKLQSNGVSYKF